MFIVLAIGMMLAIIVAIVECLCTAGKNAKIEKVF